MKTCPKCGGRIHIYNVSQYCPHCKANLMFYGFEERFYRDAKITELSMANVRVKFQKFKVGLVGGKLQLFRLLAVLLPVAALLAPHGSVSINLPVFSKTFSVDGLGFFNAFSDGTFVLLGGFKDAMIIGDTAKTLQMAYFALLATAVFAVLVLVFSVLSFISFKKMAAALCAFSALGIGAGVATTLIAFKLSAVGEMIAVKSSPLGLIALTVGFGIVFALNFVIAKKGLPIEYKPFDLERMEVRKKYLKKQINLDDLPFPIYETEEEKQARLEKIRKTQEEYAIAEGGDK